MDSKEVETIKALVKKYNDVLLNSMSIAVTEDLVNLIVVNNEDEGFELSEMVKQKANFKQLVTSEFLKINANSVLDDLKNMDDEFISKMSLRKKEKGFQKRLDL
jgi:hypothetical protein